jgi:hypothetical protein
MPGDFVYCCSSLQPRHWRVEVYKGQSAIIACCTNCTLWYLERLSLRRGLALRTIRIVVLVDLDCKYYPQEMYRLENGSLLMTTSILLQL